MPLGDKMSIVPRRQNGLPNTCTQAQPGGAVSFPQNGERRRFVASDNRCLRRSDPDTVSATLEKRVVVNGHARDGISEARTRRLLRQRRFSRSAIRQRRWKRDSRSGNADSANRFRRCGKTSAGRLRTALRTGPVRKRPHPHAAVHAASFANNGNTGSHSPRALSRTLNRRKPGISSHWAQPLALRVPLPPRWCRQLLDHPVCRRVRAAARRLFPLPPRRHIPVDTPRFELRQVPLIAGSTVSGCASKVSFTSSSNPVISPWSLAFDVNSVATINRCSPSTATCALQHCRNPSAPVFTMALSGSVKLLLSSGSPQARGCPPLRSHAARAHRPPRVAPPAPSPQQSPPTDPRDGATPRATRLHAATRQSARLPPHRCREPASAALLFQTPLLLAHPTGAHRLALARVRPNLRPVYRQLPETQKPRLARQAHHLHEQPLELLQVPAAKLAQRAVEFPATRNATSSSSFLAIPRNTPVAYP